MRQNDHVEFLAGAFGAMLFADDRLQLGRSNQCLRGECAHRNHQPGLKQPQLAIEMRSAVRDLGGRWDAVAARFRIAPGKAADHRAHVNAAAKCRFIDTEWLEPAEQPSARGVCEWTSILHFVRARRLPDEHHLCAFDCAGHRLAENIRTETTGLKRRQMPLKSAGHAGRNAATPQGNAATIRGLQKSSMKIGYHNSQ